VLRSLRISNLVLIREAELDLVAGLNAITGETGAGKTILTNAIGLLLGAKGDAALIGAAGDEAYVEAEFDGVDDDALGALAELRPEGEDGVVLARRIFADGRTRAYAWGRSAAREDVAAAAEALIAMSGQFEQRRLARPAYQRGVLDAFAGLDVRAAQRAWRELQSARRAYDELTRDADTAQARLEELRKLAEDTDGLEAGREDELRAERERLRHVSELADGAAAAAAALYGPLHGGANEAVIHMLERIGDKKNVPDFVKRVRAGEELAMGFGHRVYKSYDPRAKIIKRTADEVLNLAEPHPLLDIALELERIALEDEYFIERKLYPNVDFYSGLIYQALGFPVDLFPVLFAIPRTAGWLAQWREMVLDPEQKIARPRQIYVGAERRRYLPIDQR
jgi:hypothetical protein